MGTGEIIYEKVYASPRLPPKISFEDNWMKELGSEVARGRERARERARAKEKEKEERKRKRREKKR